MCDLCADATGKWKPAAEDSYALKVWKALKEGQVTRIETASDGSKLPEGSCVLRVDGARWLTHPDERGGEYLYYRKDADTFYKQVIAPLVSAGGLGQQRRMIVCGSPGIGKSYFLNAVIYNISQAALRGEYSTVVNVFLHSISRKEFVWLQFGKGAQEPREASSLTLTDLKAVAANASSVYLVDSGRGIKAKEPLVIPNATTILASSPRKDHYDDFLETGDAKMRYMPLWSWEDICSAVPWLGRGRGKTESDVRQRYDEIGGLVRYIFRDDDAYRLFISKRNAFCGQSSDFSAALVAAVENRPSDSVRQTPSTENFHKVFGLVPSADFEEFSYVVLGKPSLEDACWDKVLSTYRGLVVQYCGAREGIKFERAVKSMVLFGAYFKARRLSNAGSTRLDSVIFLPRGSRSQLFATGPLALGASRLDEAVAELTGSGILNPAVSNFPAVDALLYGLRELPNRDDGSLNAEDLLKEGVERSTDELVGLQMTITSLPTPKRHTISLHGLSKHVFAKRRSNNDKRPSIRVMFVVPSDHYESAVMQNVVVVRKEESLSEPNPSRPRTQLVTITQEDYNEDDSRPFDVEQWVVDCMPCGTSGRRACDPNAAR